MKNQKKGWVTLSVDDGGEDGYRLWQLLKQYAVGATYHIVTSWIGTEGFLSRGQLCEISRDPSMEIACHGYSHKNTDEDILLGAEQLRDWLGASDGVVGFASPGSAMKKKDVLAKEAHLREKLGLLYVRSAQNPDPSPRHLQLIQRLEEKGAPGYVVKNLPQLIFEPMGLLVPSVVVYNDTPCGYLKQLVELAADEGAWVVLMLHRVKKNGEYDPNDRWCYDYDRLEELLRCLSDLRAEGRVEILNLKDAFLRLHGENKKTETV